MTHTEILGFIRTQLQEEGIRWKSEKALFEMLIVGESWEKYKTNWDNWKHGRVHYLNRSPNIITAINETLKLPITIWDMQTNSEQKRILRECIKKFASPGKNIDLSSLMPPVHPITKAQIRLIDEVIDVHRKDEINLLNKYPEHFHSSFENQSFLLTLIPVLFDMGHYDFLYEKAFPALHMHNKTDTQIKILMAHTLGSLTKPKYLEAAKLLDVIPSKKDKQLIDLKTAAISNVRRYELTKPDLTKEQLSEILDVFIHYYHDAFITNEIHHYYPGINLAYVLYHHEKIFPDIEHNCLLSIQDIYQKSKNSIQNDIQQQNLEYQYYAKISELELMLLLEREDVESRLYLLLEETQPPYSTVERTIRQMDLFMEIFERFSGNKTNDVIQKIKIISFILNTYMGNRQF